MTGCPRDEPSLEPLPACNNDTRTEAHHDKGIMMGPQICRKRWSTLHREPVDNNSISKATRQSCELAKHSHRLITSACSQSSSCSTRP